jgi:hypothetical protein
MELLTEKQNGASGRTRTCNLLIRSQKLYPIELRMQLPGECFKVRRHKQEASRVR